MAFTTESPPAQGVTTADFPKAFIAHEFLSVAFLGLTWAACYHIQPSQSPLFAPINKTLRESNNLVVVKMRQSYQSVISKAERRMYQEWFMKRGIDSGRMAVSLAESTFFRKLAKPVTIPTKLWITWKFVQVVNGHGGEQQDGYRAAPATAAGPLVAEVGEGDRHDRRRLRKEKRDAEQHRSRREDKGARAGPAVADAVDEPWWGRLRGVLEGSPLRGARLAGGGGWGGSRGGNRRRKAVCPPWRGAGGGPGCFALPALATTPRLTKAAGAAGTLKIYHTRK